MKIVWTVLVCAGVALTAISVAFVRQGVDPANNGQVAYAGLVLSVFGVYASIVGFTLALQQIARSRSASEAAESTLSEIRAKLSSLSASGEVERARFALEETERHLIARRWSSIRHSILAARGAFVRIRELRLEIFTDLGDQIDASIREMGEISDGLEVDSKDTTSSLGGYVRSYLDTTYKMQIRLSRG